MQMRRIYLISNKRVKTNLVVSVVLTAFSSLVSAQGHPSGISQRVLIAVQNPTGTQSGNNVIVPQFSMQIADASSNSFNGSYPKLISGWVAANPSHIQNLTAEGYGAVQNDDGSAALINYSSESVSTTNIGISSPTAGTLLSHDLRYVFSANQQQGELTVIDRQTNVRVDLDLPGVINVSGNAASTVIMAFAQDVNAAYYVRHVDAAKQTAYASTWPANAVDCRPYSAPVFCLFQVVNPGGSVSAYSSNFDHPAKAVTSASGDSMYVLSAGTGGGGSNGKVTVLPTAPILFEEGSASGTIPASPTVWSLSSSGDNEIVVGTDLYVAGQAKQQTTHLWTGQLTRIDTATGTVGQAVSIGDGFATRMAVADDNTLWIGSSRCNTGQRKYEAASAGQNQVGGSPYGCLTAVSLSTGGAAFIEPWLCSIEDGAACGSGDSPMRHMFDVAGSSGVGGGGSGDVTGLAPIPGQHKIFYIENGQPHIRSTSTFATTPNNGVRVAGIAVDAVYMDAGSDTDGTANNTAR